MDFASFAARCTRHCNQYFRSIDIGAAQGKLLRQPIYPTMLLLFETPTHYAAELLGATFVFDGNLRVIMRSLPSLGHYLGHFHTSHATSQIRAGDDASGNAFAGITMVAQPDVTSFARRYPELSNLHQVQFRFSDAVASDQAHHAFDISDKSGDLWLYDVLIANSWRGQIRARYFQTSFIAHKDATEQRLRRSLNDRHPIGDDTTLLAPTAGEKDELLLAAANFASLAVLDRVGEPTITTFLEQSKRILLGALHGQRLIPQAVLPWLEGSTNPDEFNIRPDFLLVDAKGELHVVEVKLPLLEHKSLTKGGYRQPRFKDVVSAGIAQLFHYKHYLSFPAHKRLLTERYGAKVVRPRLILLIGSSENIDLEAIAVAQRMYNEFEIVDYDTVRALYLIESGYVPGGDK